MSERRVLDSSALLAVIFEEPGEERATAFVADALVSAVNLSEAAAKMNERGFDPDRTALLLGSLGFAIAAFDEADAYEAGRLRNASKDAGLSFGDRACLALALRERLPVVTADRAWRELSIEAQIELIR